MSISLIIGVFIGALFTGHPILAITEPVKNIIFYFTQGKADINSMLAMESRAGIIDFNLIIIIAALLIWRTLRSGWSKKSVDNPVFILGILCMLLGCIVIRFSMDWGIPAIMVWMAQEFEEFFREKLDYFSWKRLMLTVVLCGVLFLGLTSDPDNRWTAFKPIDYISADDPDQAPWLPEPGGIIYSDNYGVFYRTFFKNPNANWKYMLGCEPILMPPEDLAVLRDIQRNHGNYKFFYPWVKKMTTKDRLIIRGTPDSKPRIPELEWYYVAHGTWSGRLPKSSVKPPKN